MRQVADAPVYHLLHRRLTEVQLFPHDSFLRDYQVVAEVLGHDHYLVVSFVGDRGTLSLSPSLFVCLKNDPALIALSVKMKYYSVKTGNRLKAN